MHRELSKNKLKVRLFEIFTSIEGEGILYGTKTLFIRLAGCPFTCFYCDTGRALPLNSGNEYYIDDVYKIIDSKLQKKTYKVNFTGGEPLIQHKAVLEMAKYIQSKNIPTYLESSCFDFNKFSLLLPYMNYIKIEFKTIDSEFVDQEHYGNILQNELKCLQNSILHHKTLYIKILIGSGTNLSNFRKLLVDIFGVSSKEDIAGFVLQPIYGKSKPTLSKLLKFYDSVYPYYEEVRIVPQLHKFINAS